MTIKHNNKNISAENTLVLSANEGDVVLQNGFLRLKRKNLYDESDEAEDIVLDLFDLSPKLIMLASKSELDAIGQSNDADVKKERSRHAYLVPHENSTQADPWYVEYIWVESKNAFESLGSIKADLEPLKSKLNSLESDMSTAKTDISGLKSRVGTLENNKVDKESGKSLIETSKIAKLDGIQDGANKTVVDTEIKTSNNPVSNTAIKDALSNKVDKEAGKSLMTDAERTKLNGIEAEANKTVVVDAVTDGESKPVSSNAVYNALQNVEGLDIPRILLKNSMVYDYQHHTDGDYYSISLDLSSKISVPEGKSKIFLLDNGYYSDKLNYEFTEVYCRYGRNITYVENTNVTSLKPNDIILCVVVDFSDYLYMIKLPHGATVDSVIDGNMNPVTSNAVYDALQSIQSNANVDLTNYIQKSNTTGLIKNDGTIDANTYALSSTVSSLSSRVSDLENDLENKVNSSEMELTALDITYTNGDTDQIFFYTKPKTSNGG